MSTKTSIRLFVWLGVTFVTVSLIAISLLTYSQVANTRASRNLVLETMRTIQRQQRFLACLRSAETGQRGYLLTHNSSYLVPYNHCSVEVLPALDSLTTGPLNPDTAQAYATVRRLTTYKLNELAKTIAQSKTEGFDKALATVKTNSGMNSMEEVQSIVDGLRVREESELKAKSAELDARVQNLERMISFSSITGILAVMGTGLWMIKFLTEKTRVHPDDLKMVRKAVSDHLKHRIPFECEYRIKGDDGVYYWCNSGGQPLWDAQGNPIRFSGSLRDISERKEAERRISEFYSTVSHELRTPLTSIRGSLGLIEGGKAGEVPPKIMRLITTWSKPARPKTN